MASILSWPQCVNTRLEQGMRHHQNQCWPSSLMHIRHHFVYAPSQWETTWQCNVVSHWLGTYTKWSLHICVSSRMNGPNELKGVAFLAATKQLYEWYFLSVCPSVRLSVRLSVCPSVTPFWLCSHHRIIMKFSGVITLDQGKVHAKGQGQRSKVKVTEVTTQIFVSGL